MPGPKMAGPDYEAGVNLIRQMLRNAREPRTPGQPYLKICRRCTGLIDNFQAWEYRKNAKGEIPEGAERYSPSDDHAIDVLRYILCAHYLERQQAHRRWKLDNPEQYRGIDT